MRDNAERGGIIFRFLGFLLLLAILALLFLFRHPVMRFAGEMWVVNEPPVSADVIVVLGDDNYAGDRAARAAELYREGLAGQVVASGRMLRPQAGMADLMAQDLERDGVPAASIAKSPYGGDSDSIDGEVKALKDLVVKRGWKRVLVVTSNYNARLARLVFQRDFPSDVTIRVTAAADHDFDPSLWWWTRTGQQIFLSEIETYLAERAESFRR